MTLSPKIKDAVTELAKHAREVHFEDLSPEEQRAVAKYFTITRLSQELEDLIRKEGFETQDHIELWLNTFPSDSTRRNYRRAIGILLAYLDKRNQKRTTPIHILDINAKLVTEFVVYLKTYKHFSENTLRWTFFAISSFYTFLEGIEVIPRNPFKQGTRKGLPRHEYRYKSPDAVMSEQELLVIFQTIKQDTSVSKGQGHKKRKAAAQWLLPVVYVMVEYGIRVGTLSTLRVILQPDGTGWVEGKTKRGKIIHKRFSAETMQLIQKAGMSLPYPFADIHRDTIRKGISRLCSRLCQEGKLANTYSAHGFRHFAAKREYVQSGFDIEHTRRFLDHSDITTTQNYLATLGFE